MIEWADGKNYLEFKDPFTISAEKLWDDIQQYDSVQSGVKADLLH